MISYKSVLLLFFIVSFMVFNRLSAQKSLLSVAINDENGQMTPVRVRMIHSNGKSAPLPQESVSIMYGRNDKAERYAYQTDSSFYVAGKFKVELMPGKYSVSLSKGYEYLTQKHVISIPPNNNVSHSFTMEKWIDMPNLGWYSADDHIHIRRSPRENPLILKWIAAEDIHVGALLQMGDFWTTYFAQYAWGKDGIYREDDRLLTSGQEDPRTHEIGHTISLAADDFVRFRDNYYLYSNVFERVHELGGLTGYAHQGMSFKGYRGMTLNILQENVDFLELLQFCVDGGPLLTDHYYFFLDLGFKLTATAGSDFPWCGNGPRFGVEGAKWNAQIGNARFYTFIKDEFSFNNWKENFKAGHTFVSSGPIIDLKINGKIPGDNLKISKGEEITITAEAFGHSEQIPLQNLEIIGHGNVLKTVTDKDPNQSTNQLSIEMKYKADYGIWIAARCSAGPSQVAHTTPIYVTIDDGGFYNFRTVKKNLDKCELYLREIEDAINNPPLKVDYNIWRYKEGLLKQIEDVRSIINDLRKKYDSLF